MIDVGAWISTVWDELVKKPRRGTAYVAHGLKVAAAAACLLIAILAPDWAVRDLVSAVFGDNLEAQTSTEAETWVRIGWAVLAAALVVFRAVWIDAALLVVGVLVVMSVVDTYDEARATLTDPKPTPTPEPTPAANQVRVVVPKAKLESVGTAIAVNDTAVLITVIERRGDEGVLSTTSRSHDVQARAAVAAGGPEEDVPVDVVRGENDGDLLSVTRDVTAAKTIYLVPD